MHFSFPESDATCCRLADEIFNMELHNVIIMSVSALYCFGLEETARFIISSDILLQEVQREGSRCGNHETSVLVHFPLHVPLLKANKNITAEASRTCNKLEI